MIRFNSHSQFALWDFGWCSILKYGYSEDDKELIDELLNNKYYKMTYIQPFSSETFDADIHGPFISTKIRKSDFIRISEEKFREYIKNIYEDKEFSEEPNRDQKSTVDNFLENIQKSEIYALNLNENNKDKIHETGWILILFKEFLIIDKTNSYIYQIIFGYD